MALANHFASPRAIAVYPRVVGSWERGLQALGVSKPRNLEYSAKAEGASDIEAP